MTRILSVLALACSAFAQAPAFEVASVKRSEPITPELVNSGRLQIGVSIDARNVRMSKMSLYDLVTLAYQIKPHQLSAPSWMATERFDIQAKLPEDGKRGQVPAMLQTLLADRFRLKIHREARDFNVLALVEAKGGHKLKPSAPDAPDAPPPSPQLRGGVTVGPGGTQTHTGPGGDSRITPGPNGSVHIETKKMTLKSLADFLNRYCERPVVDMTNLPGLYDAEFDVSGEEAASAARAHGAVIRRTGEEASDPTGPSLTSSLQKVGLRLDGRKAPLEVIVVDSVEKVPTEN
jgi:uncharacterized protein (TIGR03435 family)